MARRDDPEAPRREAGGPAGTLYVVGTPIGNLDDLSPRARQALSKSALIACEDTRRTRVLVDRLGLRARLVSCHKFNEAERADPILAALCGGESVALASDGGMPALSDPGALLVRRAHAAGIRVVPIPGPSALTALWSASGFPPGPFTFVGFLPHRRGERGRALERLRTETRPLVFFESPLRLIDALDDLLEIFGDREAFLGREMTKLHEELIPGTLSSIRAAFASRTVRGEVSFMVAGAAEQAGGARGTEETAPPESPAAAVARLVAAGGDPKEAMRRVARERGLSRREVYREVLRERGRSGGDR